MSRTGRWGVWVAGIAAAVTAVVMMVALAGWRLADDDAADASAQVQAAESRAAQRTEDLRAATDATADAEARAQALSGLIEPGMANELGAVYLRLAVAACADREAEATEVIAQVATEATAASDTLAAHPGWEQAIGPDAVERARATCDG